MQRYHSLQNHLPLLKEIKPKAHGSLKPGTVTTFCHSCEMLPKIAACWTASTDVKDMEV